MTTPIIVVNLAKTLAVATAATDIAVVVFLVLLLTAFLRGRLAGFLGSFWMKMISRKALLLGFLVAFLATVGSLFLSEIAGMEPCKLCWLERIFIYPQTVILGLAVWKNDRKIADYCLLLSVFGWMVAAYHVYLRSGGYSFLTCATSLYAVPCNYHYSLEFGPITFPVMSLTVFTLLVILLKLLKISDRD